MSRVRLTNVDGPIPFVSSRQLELKVDVSERLARVEGLGLWV